MIHLFFLVFSGSRPTVSRNRYYCTNLKAFHQSSDWLWPGFYFLKLFEHYNDFYSSKFSAKLSMPSTSGAATDAAAVKSVGQLK